MEVKS